VLLPDKTLERADALTPMFGQRPRLDPVRPVPIDEISIQSASALVRTSALFWGYR
jgi:hypothetical protein